MEKRNIKKHNQKQILQRNKRLYKFFYFFYATFFSFFYYSNKVSSFRSHSNNLLNWH